MNKLFLLFFVILLSSCALESDHEAPVIDGWKQPSVHQHRYKVQKGDTLYSIAWAFNMDYRTLARLNRLSPPYSIYPSQQLRMDQHAVSRYTKPKPKRSAIWRKKHSIDRSKYRASMSAVRFYPVMRWRWPAKGKVIERYYYKAGGNKGINITGRYGSPVLASAAGKVVYSGSGLKGYGKLIIIKHNSTYLSAYANNRRLLVSEGMFVKAGQKIAQMGKTDRGRVQLHFEIRRNGKPINPLKFLK